jgi:hypothetical protein
MAIIRIRSRAITPESYDAAIAKLDLDHQHPLGLIMHGASEVDGGMQVAEVWESAEHARRYDDEILRPALEAINAPLDAESAVYELHHLVTP